MPHGDLLLTLGYFGREKRTYGTGRSGLLADSESVEQRHVHGVVRPLDVIKEATTLAHELQESAARVVVLGMDLEVLREVRDALTQ